MKTFNLVIILFPNYFLNLCIYNIYLIINYLILIFYLKKILLINNIFFDFQYI